MIRDTHALTRREWLAAVPPAAVIAAATPLRAMSAQDKYEATSATTLHAEFPSHDPATVRELVAAAHARIDRVRELVEASPALAKTAWDWGFGDWETALGAASHMGRQDIAELLMKHGARPDLFTFAMLGHLDIVKAYVEAMPGIQRTPGPHDITLMSHARSGGEQARAVVEHLESVGDADVGATSLDITDAQKRLYIGRYSFGRGDGDIFEVLTNRRGALAIKRGERFGRTLHRVEEHGFAPSGASAVRIRFDVKDGRALALTIHDPAPLVKALRTE